MKPPIAFAVAFFVPVTVAIAVTSFSPRTSGTHSVLDAIYLASLLLSAVVATLWQPSGHKASDLVSAPVAASAGFCLAAAANYAFGPGAIALYEPTISDVLLRGVDKLWLHAVVELLISFVLVAAVLAVLAATASQVRKRWWR